MGGVDGFVEEIGFRSTRIRTLEKSYVSVPNKTVSSEAIDNWTRLTHRRVFQTVGVTYETTADQMEEAVRRIEELLDNDDGVDKAYYLVKFEGFGDSSLNIWLYYFTDPDWGKHLEVKQRINLAVMRILDDMGLAIAFPTRTLYFEGDIAKALAERGVPDSGHHPPPGPVGQGEDRGGEDASGS
jgi:MscS family membrane protein